MLMKKNMFVSLLFLPLVMSSCGGGSAAHDDRLDTLPDYNFTVIFNHYGDGNDFKSYFQKAGNEYYYTDERDMVGYYFNDVGNGKYYEINYWDEETKFVESDAIFDDDTENHLARYLQFYFVLNFLDTSVLSGEFAKKTSETADIIGYTCECYQDELSGFKYYYNSELKLILRYVESMHDPETEDFTDSVYEITSFKKDTGEIVDSPSKIEHNLPEY